MNDLSDDYESEDVARVEVILNCVEEIDAAAKPGDALEEARRILDGEGRDLEQADDLAGGVPKGTGLGVKPLVQL